MPTFRQDTKLGTKVPQLKTDDYNDYSVTEKKLEKPLADKINSAKTGADSVRKEFDEFRDNVNASEQKRAEAEASRKEAESLRVSAEKQREDASKQAVSAVNDAVSSALDTANHPTIIGEDHYVYEWNKSTKSYDKTNIYVKGDPMTIVKDFSSIAEMQEYKGSDVKIGDLVIICSDTEDVDNAKLFVKKASGWQFIVDLSGFRGFEGKTPQISIGTVTTLPSGSQAEASLSPDGTDTNGNPKFKLNISIPKGDKMTLAGLSESELAELQKPATNAIAKCDAAASNANAAALSANTAASNANTLTDTVQNATATALKAATTANEMSEAVKTDEQKRVDAENQRIADENIRKSNETARQNAENKRISAETKRVSDTSTALSNCTAATNAANTAATNADVSRAAIEKNENDRKLAETNRANAETNRVSAESKRVSDFSNMKSTVEDAASAAEQASGVVEGYNKRLTNVENTIEEMGYSQKAYYVASQDTDQASPELTNVQTNRSVAMLENMYRPFLINHTENTEDTMPADELMRNNWLRYTDGRFAPVVGITEEMRAQCDVELYLDEEHIYKYCDAGEFDAEAFYNKYGMEQKLYNSNGVEISHILRPWETTSKNYSVKIGDPTDTWLLDDYSPEDNLMYKGILKSFREVAGLKPKKLAPTLLSPTCDTSITEGGKIKFRSFFFLYNPGDSNTKGGMNDSFKITMFMENGAYPRVNDVNQITSMNYSRNNNPDPQKTYPFCEMGFHAYNTFIISQELKYGTNYINNPDNLFSSGTSSNNSCTNESQWNKYGGIRFKTGNSSWAYALWYTTPKIYSNASGDKINTHMSSFLNREYPKWMCNEAQIVLSFATELGIAEDTEFDVYGRTYKYTTPSRAKGLTDGYMNAIVYRQVNGDWQGFTADGSSTTYHFEAMLRQGVMDGIVTSGDIFHYRGGGYEQVSKTVVDWNTNRNDYPTDLYLETDQRKFHSIKTVSFQNENSSFGFEKQYEHLARIESTKEGWIKKRVGYTPHEQSVGGDINTYVTGFNDNNNYFNNNIGQLTRRAVRCGGTAIWSSCSSRYLSASAVVSYAYRFNGGSAQCLFRKRS